jgi:hypothetical protein
MNPQAVDRCSFRWAANSRLTVRKAMETCRSGRLEADIASHWDPMGSHALQGTFRPAWRPCRTYPSEGGWRRRRRRDLALFPLLPHFLADEVLIFLTEVVEGNLENPGPHPNHRFPFVQADQLAVEFSALIVGEHPGLGPDGTREASDQQQRHTKSHANSMLHSPLLAPEMKRRRNTPTTETPPNSLARSLTSLMGQVNAGDLSPPNKCDFSHNRYREKGPRIPLANALLPG